MYPPELVRPITHVLLGVRRHFKVPGHSTQRDLFPGSIGKVVRRRLRIEFGRTNFCVALERRAKGFLTRWLLI